MPMPLMWIMWISAQSDAGVNGTEHAAVESTPFVKSIIPRHPIRGGSSIGISHISTEHRSSCW